jgi:tripartite-type tricarboxylate transporter receptor subunit TctC
MGLPNLLLGALGALGGIVAAASASAQSYPSRAIKLIVPITAGSGTDVLARALADKLAQVRPLSALLSDTRLLGNFGLVQSSIPV